MHTILIIDDNPDVTEALRLLFGLDEIRTLAAQSPEEGLALLSGERVDLVIADMNFSADTTSGEEGGALFGSIRARFPDMPVILLTAWSSLESAVSLVKAGAADYLSKPWNNDRLRATVQNLLELSEDARERERLQGSRRLHRERLASANDLGDLVFESEGMASVLTLACRVARTSMPVLITGPNGVGKDRIASIVHRNSAVRAGPFVTVNCGALPSELIEAELFGAEVGAYTGMHRARVGRFELGHGGTLFLDEIANLPLGGQMKLLRVLESGEYEPLGSSHTRRAQVRVVSATNADLPAAIREGRFREDLYYRINVCEVAVPPLAERSEDIVPLAEHFLGSDMRLSADAQAAMLRYPWPGNVRELRNVMERAKLLARADTVHAADLNLAALRRGPALLVVEASEIAARHEIERTLRAARGNISRAAQALGISRQSLYRRMERFGISLAGQAE
jgi:DNA-binding NtrC family response regulator